MMAGNWLQGMRRRFSRSLSEESEPVEGRSTSVVMTQPVANMFSEAVPEANAGVDRASPAPDIVEEPADNAIPVERARSGEGISESSTRRYHTRSQDATYGSPTSPQGQEVFEEQITKEEPLMATRRDEEWGMYSLNCSNIFCFIFVRCTNQLIDTRRTPPSRFQKRKGSLLATQASRFGGGRIPRSTSKERDQNYFQKIQEKVCSDASIICAFYLAWLT